MFIEISKVECQEKRVWVEGNKCGRPKPSKGRLFIIGQSIQKSALGQVFAMAVKM